MCDIAPAAFRYSYDTESRVKKKQKHAVDSTKHLQTFKEGECETKRSVEGGGKKRRWKRELAGKGM